MWRRNTSLPLISSVNFGYISEKKRRWERHRWQRPGRSYKAIETHHLCNRQCIPRPSAMRGLQVICKDGRVDKVSIIHNHREINSNQLDGGDNTKETCMDFAKSLLYLFLMRFRWFLIDLFSGGSLWVNNDVEPVRFLPNRTQIPSDQLLLPCPWPGNRWSWTTLSYARLRTASTTAPYSSNHTNLPASARSELCEQYKSQFGHNFYWKQVLCPNFGVPPTCFLHVVLTLMYRY